MFTEITIKDQSYQLRLNTRTSIALEKTIGKNPLVLLLKMDEGEFPTLTEIITILHAMLQPMNHGITIDKTYELYDDYVAEGHTMFDLIPIIVEVFQNSGYLTKENNESKEQASEVKNA